MVKMIVNRGLSVKPSYVKPDTFAYYSVVCERKSRVLVARTVWIRRKADDPWRVRIGLLSGCDFLEDGFRFCMDWL